jgi:hypothetical protein
VKIRTFVKQEMTRLQGGTLIERSPLRVENFFGFENERGSVLLTVKGLVVLFRKAYNKNHITSLYGIESLLRPFLYHDF